LFRWGWAQDGAEIIDALCSKSKSFGDKTVFSQEKYRKKKARKYQAVATVRRPTAATVADSYFRRVPTKICGLRPDTLAVMLTMANVGPHQQVHPPHTTLMKPYFNRTVRYPI
jgi:tRNA (adenine-N(1)-)-methyltransferase non-catalytic subunit